MLICFTDLDGTLLNHDDYRYDAAIPVIRRLKVLGIPVIPNTSKTRAEVMDLRQALDLTDPFVVENGSGLFLEQGDQRFDLKAESVDVRLKKVYLGLSYREATDAVDQLSQDLGIRLKGFGSMTESELIDATHLPLADLKRACDREFSEPFIRPAQISVEQLEAWAEQHHYQILVGNRFCHMLGLKAGKGNAVRQLKQAFRAPGPITTVGLGDSPNDISMLEAVDIPVVVPGVKGPHPRLAERGWKIAPATGCRGWAAAMGEIVEDLTP